MKILIISSLFPPNIYGGAEVVAYNFAVSLVNSGHDVHVVTIKEPDEGHCWGSKQEEGFTLYKLATKRNHTLYSRGEVGSAKEKLKWHMQDHFDHQNVDGWSELLSEIEPDHINIQNIMGLGFNVLPVIANGKASVTYVAHDFALVCFKTTMFKRAKVCHSTCLQCRPSSVVRQHYFKKMKRVGVISPTKVHLKKLQKSFPYLSSIPKLVLHNAQPEISNLPEHIPSTITRLIYVGRVEEIKGISFLLRVLHDLASEHTFHLSVFGTGSDEKALVEQYGKESWVSFNGFVPSNEIPKYLVQSDFYCIPSLWPEVYGMTTALALKLGVPVIGSNIGGTSELVDHGKTGLLVEANCISSWKGTLKKVFEDKSLSSGMKQQLVIAKDGTGEQAMLDQFISFVSEL